MNKPTIIERRYVNLTGFWQVVGNYQEVISEHNTRAEAIASLECIDIDESPWANAFVLAPGQEISGRLQAPQQFPSDDSQLPPDDDLFA